MMNCPHCRQKLGFAWNTTMPKLKNGVCPACGNKAVVAFNTRRMLIALPVTVLALLVLGDAVPVQVSAFVGSLALVLATVELRRA